MTDSRTENENQSESRGGQGPWRHRLTEDAAVKILVFTDFECPSCRYFSRGPERAIRRQYGSTVSVTIRHWPLPYHRLAMPAARASECAAEQGAFYPMYDLLFEKQDSIGLKPFRDFARDSGVGDLDSFDSCLTTARPDSRIVADTNAARQVKGFGTPTILVNGLRLANTPDSAALDRLVKVALKHRPAAE